jgi:hypothetical protein
VRGPSSGFMLRVRLPFSRIPGTPVCLPPCPSHIPSFHHQRRRRPSSSLTKPMQRPSAVSVCVCGSCCPPPPPPPPPHAPLWTPAVGVPVLVWPACAFVCLLPAQRRRGSCNCGRGTCGWGAYVPPSPPCQRCASHTRPPFVPSPFRRLRQASATALHRQLWLGMVSAAPTARGPYSVPRQLTGTKTRLPSLPLFPCSPPPPQLTTAAVLVYVFAEDVRGRISGEWCDPVGDGSPGQGAPSGGTSDWGLAWLVGQGNPLSTLGAAVKTVGCRVRPLLPLFLCAHPHPAPRTHAHHSCTAPWA